MFRNLFANDAPTAPEDLPRNATQTNAFNASSSSSSSASNGFNSTTQLRKVHTKDMKKPSGEANGSPNAIGEEMSPESDGSGGKAHDNGTMESNGNANSNSNSNGGSGFTRRNSTRSGLHSDLSKYGPWGYLMLGMLLCGGALLICGLWGTFNCTLL